MTKSEIGEEAEAHVGATEPEPHGNELTLQIEPAAAAGEGAAQRAWWNRTSASSGSLRGVP
jgi:hypothetical protein